MPGVDPLAALITQRPLNANNHLRGRIVARACAGMPRAALEKAIEAAVIEQIEFAQAEAIARDRKHLMDEGLLQWSEPDGGQQRIAPPDQEF